MINSTARFTVLTLMVLFAPYSGADTAPKTCIQDLSVINNSALHKHIRYFVALLKREHLESYVESPADLIRVSPFLPAQMKEKAEREKQESLKVIAADPRISLTLLDIQHALNNPEEISSYVNDLLLEIAQEPKTRLQSRRPDRKVFRLVLERRLTKKYGGFYSLNQALSDEDFRQLVRAGIPVYDQTHVGDSHGALTHALQMDFIYQYVVRHYGLNMHEFWNFLGSPQGYVFWVELFDNNQEITSWSKPEYIRQMFEEHLGIYL